MTNDCGGTDKKKMNPDTPLETASFLPKWISFWWLNPLFRISWKRRLEPSDLFQLRCSDQSNTVLREFDREWDKEIQISRNGGTPSLFRAVLRTFGLGYCLLGIPCLIAQSIRVAYPIFIGLLVDCFLPQSTASKTDSYLYAMAISISAFAIIIFEQLYYFTAYVFGMRLRIVLSAAVYRKTLKLSCATISQISIGRVVNLLANDMLKFNEVTHYIHFLWIGPVTGIAMIATVWIQIGWVTLGIIGVLIIFIVLKTYLASRLAKVRIKYLHYADERIKIMSEIINGMRVIKMYAWEKPFLSVVKNIRRHEIKHVLRIGRMRAVFIAMTIVAPILMVYVTMVAYSLLGNVLNPSLVFTIYSLVNGIQLIIIFSVPQAIQHAAEARISLKRIEDYLLSEELPISDTEQDVINRTHDNNSQHVIEVVDLSVWWSEDYKLEPVIKAMSFTVKKNELCAIVGPVGSGKSSLFLALLNDLTTYKGNHRIHGKIAYVSQQAWILSDTVRNNILFGLKYDFKKYNQVIEACALRKDLDELSNGDMTFVGERGLQLSGGQKVRINLARAVYHDADVYLLDDPLSAVDANVAQHIYQKCICAYLSNKTRLLITHQLHHLKSADKIIVFKNGSIDCIDIYENLVQNCDFFSMLADDERESTYLPQADQEYESSLDAIAENEISMQLSVVASDKNDQHEHEEVIDEESREKGSISWKSYFDYFVTGYGITRSGILCAILVLSQASFNITDWWLSQWSFMYRNVSHSRNSSVELDTMVMYGLSNSNAVVVYTILLLLCCTLTLIRSLMLADAAVLSSQRFQNKMLDNVLRTVIHIFDTYPTGRILNRFSKDCAQMDDNITHYLTDTTQFILLAIGSFLTIGLGIPWLIIPITIITILFIAIKRYYLNLSRDIKRLEATSSSPIYSHLCTTLQGITTLRAYNATSRFLEEFKQHLDRHTQAWIIFLASTRWIAFHLDSLCALLVVGVSFGSLIVPEDYLNPGIVALLLSYSVSLLGLLDWTVRLSTELENQMTSVERVKEYSKLPKEADLVAKDDPSLEWPKSGCITYKNVSFAHYDNLPYALNSITCEIGASEKIGIIGRTGAGKSSFMASIFRMAEPQGEILIDDVIINNIGLNRLRSSISVIPQDPVLFIGTIRTNLDPFDCYSDEQLWQALHEVQMGRYVGLLANKLNSKVAEFGANFSVGQRQLLCLSRAILKKNRILFVDEATANVDLKTDAIIQRTIRKKFANCTVLVIAHRLNTVIDCDRIMVLEEGKIVEFDVPHLLLESDGCFSNMVSKTGIRESRSLRTKAKFHYENRNEVVAGDEECNFISEHVTVRGGHVQVYGKDRAFFESCV